MTEVTIATPNGPFRMKESDGHLTACSWQVSAHLGGARTPLLDRAAAQVAAYYAGTLTCFDLPWRVDTSPFQRAACALIAAIPFGETITYGDMASRLGVSPQAAGRGCGGNPLPLIIPCHRVLGSNGLGGFSGSGGVETKVWLLRHEGAASLLI